VGNDSDAENVIPGDTPHKRRCRHRMNNLPGLRRYCNWKRRQRRYRMQAAAGTSSRDNTSGETPDLGIDVSPWATTRHQTDPSQDMITLWCNNDIINFSILWYHKKISYWSHTAHTLWYHSYDIIPISWWSHTVTHAANEHERSPPQNACALYCYWINRLCVIAVFLIPVKKVRKNLSPAMPNPNKVRKCLHKTIENILCGIVVGNSLI
jgi:hypothetical protein